MKNRIIDAINNIFRNKLGYIMETYEIVEISENYSGLKITFKNGEVYQITVESNK
jgi:hypothetical protein